ncbi:hypothetical protein JTE90_022411 [Oedothorax gibbosus]|uniref:Uncharacterized protein n=1 Tax=Oedothorax gibbosus TaxID=931172 RepID=A0AAV6U2U9_9ARAC|nr:hypothetical protein JTE90_022411 [Oedothorax gibbosus]
MRWAKVEQRNSFARRERWVSFRKEYYKDREIVWLKRGLPVWRNTPSCGEVARVRAAAVVVKRQNLPNLVPTSRGGINGSSKSAPSSPTPPPCMARKGGAQLGFRPKAENIQVLSTKQLFSVEDDVTCVISFPVEAPVEWRDDRVPYVHF